jgi:hypothetical protein
MLYPAELRAPAWETHYFSVCSSRLLSQMSRNSLAGETQVRREVLDEEMASLREVPYSLWKDVLDKPVRKIVTARDNRDYALTVTAELAADGSDDIRVTLSLTRAGLLRRGVQHQAFTITRENTFRV